MKKMLIVAALGILCGVLASPVLAGGYGHYRGHPCRVVRGGYHTAWYAPYPRARYHTSLYFGFGAPIYAPAPAYYYRPAPVYAPPYVYEPYAPVWVPGHYVYDGRARFWIEGSWSR